MTAVDVMQDTASVAALLDEAQLAWRPPPRRRLSEWADERFYLSAESAAEPGRWRTLPYQRAILDAFTDSLVTMVSLMKSARVGWTKCLNAVIGYHIDYDPCAMMLIQPTLTDAKGYSKEEIAPMLRDCAVLAERIPERMLKKNSMLHIRFPGGLLQLVGSRSPASFRRVSRRMVLGDEVDGYPASAGEEGDPISLATRRTEYFWNRKLGWGSTPTKSGVSRIEQLYLAGDQRRFYVPCTQCGHLDYFVFEREASDDEGEARGHIMRWTRGAPADAHFVCRSCGGVIEEKDKRRIIQEADDRQRAGEAGVGWVAHAPFTGHASFHIWAAYSYSPNASWAHIASEYEAAQAAGPEQLQTFVNTALGETWKESVDAPDWERLYERRESYELGTCPAGVLFLTAGVDVQEKHLVYEVVGWGRGKESWSVDAGAVPCNTSSADEVKKQLDILLERSFSHALGVEMKIAMLAIDSGFNTQTVYAAARTYPLTRVIAVKGTDKSGVLIGHPSKVDFAPSGKKVGTYKVWRVAGAIGKTEIYGWLNLKAPKDDERAAGVGFPAGYCHFPQHGEDYFKQLVAEQQVKRKEPSGFTVLVWMLPAGRQNHILDARVYARAAASVHGLDRSKEADWRRLEESLGVVHQPTPDAEPKTPASTPNKPAAAAPPRSSQKQPWIRRRGERWIRKKDR